jgi:superfamily II DNA or RNA helicase
MQPVQPTSGPAHKTREAWLEAAIDQDAITASAVEEILAYGHDRKSWLVFCAGVDHAFHVRDALRAKGIACATIVGDTPGPEREAIIAAFKAGQIRCLTNANVLTTGFNAPGVDLIAMLRPTQSAGLYVQIVGRGCRLAQRKRPVHTGDKPDDGHYNAHDRDTPALMYFCDHQQINRPGKQSTPGGHEKGQHRVGSKKDATHHDEYEQKCGENPCCY